MSTHPLRPWFKRKGVLLRGPLIMVVGVGVGAILSWKQEFPQERVYAA